MPVPEASFRVNLADVAAKVIDGEAIIMNLTNGAYYSMDGMGALVWDLLAQGHPPRAIADAVGQRYAADASVIGSDVARLAEELQREGLLVPAEPGAPAPAGIPTASGERAAYVRPELNKYTDMADLLALDPPMPAIGEVHGG